MDIYEQQAYWRHLRNYLQFLACTMEKHTIEYKKLVNRITWIENNKL